MPIGELSIDTDEIFCRPVSVAERAPSVIFVVKYDWPADSLACDSSLNVVDSLFEFELWCVYSENNEPVIGVLCVPLLEERKSPYAVNTRVGPEIDEYDFVIPSLIGNFCRIFCSTSFGKWLA